MVQPDVDAQAAVLPSCQVPGAPQPHRAVLGARRQVLAVAAEVQACHRAAVALQTESGHEGHGGDGEEQ